MNSITITMEATPENLKKLSKLLAEDEPVVEEPKTAKKQKAAPVETVTDPAVPENMEAPQPELKNVSLSDIKKLGVKMVRADRNSELEAIFTKYGGTKLSDIPEGSYGAVYAELEALI